MKLLSGPSLGFLHVIIWSKLGFLNVIIWSKFVFLPIKIVVSRDLVCTLSYHFVFFFCAQLSGNFLKIGFFNFQCFKYKI